MSSDPQIKLSILIPTLDGREKYLDRVMGIIDKQKTPEVEVLTFKDDGQRLTGTKRNVLVHQARGQYVSFVDDDDRVAPDYVPLVLRAIQTGPDVVGMYGVITIDGEDARKRRFYHSLKYDKWFTKGGHYYRCPNHLNPVKREIAMKVPYKDVVFDEDFMYSMALRNSGLLKTEVYVDSCLYLYDFRSSK